MSLYVSGDNGEPGCEGTEESVECLKKERVRLSWRKEGLKEWVLECLKWKDPKRSFGSNSSF